MEERRTNVGQNAPRLRVYKYGLRIKGQWVFPVGFYFSFPCLTAQNFGSDDTHILRTLLNVRGIRAHNETHSPHPQLLLPAAIEQETQNTQFQSRLGASKALPISPHHLDTISSLALLDLPGSLSPRAVLSTQTVPR